MKTSMTVANIPRISVIIPLYNKEQHIANTLQSVINQTLAAAEIIVVDDGSTDGSADVVKTFSDVQLIQQENSGVSAARNHGIARANGDYIAFIDADDKWLPHFLEEIAQLIKQFPQAGCFATAYQFFDGKHYRNPKIRTRNKLNCSRMLDDYFEIGARGDLPFMMSSIVISQEAFETIGVFPLGEPMGEDQDLFCRAAIYSSIAYSPRVLSIYHLDANNRACINNIPSEACPFSVRLGRYASTESDELRAASMWDYCSAHIIHLASMNVRNGKYQIAMNLLQQRITQRIWLRKYWWLLRCSLAKYK